MRKHLLLLMVLSILVPAAASDDGIVAVQENGRTIYVDSPSSPRSEVSAHPRPRRGSVLVYWSRSEGRWKPVPAPSRWVMRAARSAAAEVSSAVAAAPHRSGAGVEPVVAPDNREILRDRAMSSAALDSIIEEAAQRHNVDPNLVRAVIKVESNFNPRALSRKGAMGLMQLMPATARSLKVSDPFDPQQNVDGGVRHLRGLLENYGGDVSLSLAAYNAGAGAVARSNGVPPYAETRNYVRKITRLYNGPALSTSASPVRMYRDANGKLVATNTE